MDISFVEITDINMVPDILMQPGKYIALVAWYMVNAPPGMYKLLINDVEMSNHFAFNGNPSDYVEIPEEHIVWTKGPSKTKKDQIMVVNYAGYEPDVPQKYDTEPVDYDHLSADTRFLIAVANSPSVVYKHPDNIPTIYNKNRCTKNAPSSTRCPFNPKTKKVMDSCLNWRRTDRVGKTCRDLMSIEDKHSSVVSYCLNSPYAEDCQCVNRVFDKSYVLASKNHKDHDYCWYMECKSGAYLLESSHTDIKCSNNHICKVEYNAKTNSGDITLKDNSMKCVYVDNTSADVPIIPTSTTMRPLVSTDVYNPFEAIITTPRLPTVPTTPTLSLLLDQNKIFIGASAACILFLVSLILLVSGCRKRQREQEEEDSDIELGRI